MHSHCGALRTALAHTAGSGRAENGQPSGWAAPGPARAPGSGAAVVGPARARAVTPAATFPGPGRAAARKRGSEAVGEGAEPRGVSPRGGREGVAMGTRRALTAAAAALGPRRETKARRGRRGFMAPGVTARPMRSRARHAPPIGENGPDAREDPEPPHRSGGGRRTRRSHRWASDYPDPAPPRALTWPAPPKAPPPREGGRMAKPRMRQRRRSRATPNGGREGNAAAALRYRRLYWRLQQRHPATLSPHSPCRDTRIAQGTGPWASLGSGSSLWAEEGAQRF